MPRVSAAAPIDLPLASSRAAVSSKARIPGEGRPRGSLTRLSGTPSSVANRCRNFNEDLRLRDIGETSCAHIRPGNPLQSGSKEAAAWAVAPRASTDRSSDSTHELPGLSADDTSVEPFDLGLQPWQRRSSVTPPGVSLAPAPPQSSTSLRFSLTRPTIAVGTG